MPDRVTFLGASVCGYQSSIGWGTQSSQLTVTLIEDTTNGDLFNPPSVGQPVYFTHSSFYFGGILQSWRQKHGETSNPIYEVTVTDPREILGGVQLILSDYFGDVTAIPNLYNVYRYWENDGSYGSARVNETGIYWGYIVNGFSSLISVKPISFRGYNYNFDFYSTLNLSSYYRVGGQSITLLDFIDEICSAGGYDYYITLEAGEVITVRTINRRIVPVFGAIEAFISMVGEVNSKEYGRELRNETNAKFLVGGQKEEFSWWAHTLEPGFSYPSGDPHNYEIWPYWGLNLNGDVVIGSGVEIVNGNNTGFVHQFTLDTRSLMDLVIGDSYITDTAEIKAIGCDQDTWETFLSGKDLDATSIHYGKATALGLSTSFDQVEAVMKTKANAAEMKATKLSELFPLVNVSIEKSKLDPQNVRQKRLNQFYGWLSNYYSDYGKKFMVRLTSNTCTYEPETDRIMSKYEPINSAFVDSSLWPIAVAGHYLPSGIFKFLTEDNKISCFVRFPDVYNPSGNYDLSELSNEDYTSWDGYLFVKAGVDENIVFRDRSTLLDPRAVITLPGRVKPKFGDSASAQLGGFEDMMGGILPDEDLPSFVSRAGADSFYFARKGSSHIPYLVALPLRSNRETYGPWYALGADGKVEYEKDETLVPWNYGGYTQMDLVGQAKVNTNISYEQANEGGTITVPGEPGNSLGAQIIEQSGYPYITDINVTVGTNGVLTTYHLQQWTPRFGTTAKSDIERFKQHSMLIQRERKKSLILNKFNAKKGLGGAPGIQSEFSFSDYFNGLPQYSRGTTSPLILAEVVPISSGVSGYSNLSFSEVVIAPYKNVGVSLGHNYTRQAMSSLDAIFRPFSVSSGYIDLETSGILIPCMEIPSGASPNATDLNPFTEPHDMSMFIMGNSVPSGGLAIDYTGVGSNPNYRPIGLRAPLMLVGYGYDTAGVPVPNSGDGQFVQNYRRRQDLWKVGPLDARWDDSKKVWTASGDSILTAKFTGSIVASGNSNYKIFIPGGSGTGYLMSGSTYGTQGTSISIYDPIYNMCALSGEYINVMGKNGRYEPVGEFGLFRHGICHNDVNPAQYGSVSVTHGTITGYVTAYDKIMETGQIISSGSLVYIDFDKTDRKFYIVESACSGSLP